MLGLGRDVPQIMKLTGGSVEIEKAVRGGGTAVAGVRRGMAVRRDRFRRASQMFQGQPFIQIVSIFPLPIRVAAPASADARRVL